MKPDELWSAWSLEPGLIIPLALSAVLYARGRRVPRSGTLLRSLCFWLGWTALTLALISPLHELGEALFSAHMIQHEILMLIAAPLLTLSRPLVPFLHGMPIQWRRKLGRWSKSRAVQSVWRFVSRPFNAWTIHGAALWIWHFPPLFDATLTNDWIHAAQHLSFLGSALLFWWSLFYRRGWHAYGRGVVYIFTTGVHTGILGALLTVTTRVWYPAYGNAPLAWGLTPLEDQQLGGLIMWVPASLVYLGAGLTMFGAWMKASEMRASGPSNSGKIYAS